MPKESIFGYFQSYGLENKSVRVVFRVEFDGDIRFWVSPPKSTRLLIFIKFFGGFSWFFHFRIFQKITDFFLNDGEIVSTKSRKPSENRKWFAKKGDLTNGKTLIVLINYGSASASEIVAGALKDHKRAIILGENSYGKGSVQSIIPLKNEGAIRLTVAKYYLPSGKSISKVGIKPDIEISEEGEEFRIKTKTDNQLNYAIKLLKG